MREEILETRMTVCTYDELTPQDRELVDAAKAISQQAYAPYSKFNVGAAVLLSNGEIVSGNNQENAAFPSGICAERTTIFYAHAHHPDEKVDTIAIAAWTGGGFLPKPISPCGACRQVLSEYEVLSKRPMRVILYGREEIYIFPSISNLLPYSFKELG